MDLLLSQLYWKVILFFSLIKLLLNYVTPTPTNHFVIYQLWLSLTKLFILFLKEKLNYMSQTLWLGYIAGLVGFKEIQPNPN